MFGAEHFYGIPATREADTLTFRFPMSLVFEGTYIVGLEAVIFTLAILLTLSRKGLGKTWGFRPSCPYLLIRRFFSVQAWVWRFSLV